MLRVQNRRDLQQTPSSSGTTHEANRDSGNKSCATGWRRRSGRRSVSTSSVHFE